MITTILILLLQTGIWTATEGDTIRKGDLRVRLYGVDAPEKDQHWGAVSTAFTISWVGSHSDIQTIKAGPYSYGRKVAWVILGADTLNIDLLRAGMAWHVGFFTDNNPHMEALMLQAKKSKRGLWVQENPVNPYEWRKKNK